MLNIVYIDLSYEKWFKVKFGFILKLLSIKVFGIYRIFSFVFYYYFRVIIIVFISI